MLKRQDSRIKCNLRTQFTMRNERVHMVVDGFVQLN